MARASSSPSSPTPSQPPFLHGPTLNSTNHTTRPHIQRSFSYCSPTPSPTSHDEWDEIPPFSMDLDEEVLGFRYTGNNMSTSTEFEYQAFKRTGRTPNLLTSSAFLEHRTRSSSRPRRGLGLDTTFLLPFRSPPPSPQSEHADFSRSSSTLSLQSKKSYRRHTSSSGLTIKMLGGRQKKGDVAVALHTESVSLPATSPLSEGQAIFSPPPSPTASEPPPSTTSIAKQSLVDIAAQSHNRRHSAPLDDLVLSNSRAPLTPPITPDLRAYLTSGRRSSLPPPSPESPENRKRGRSSSTLQFASEKLSTLRSSISLLGIRKTSVTQPIPWSDVVSIRVSFKAGHSASSSANQFFIGLRSLERGGSRSWDPRFPLPPSSSPSATPLPSPRSPSLGRAFTPLLPPFEADSWPTLSMADGDPHVLVQYADKSTRSFPAEGLSPLEIMRAVLAPHTASGSK